jgi:hypothetical protein
MRRETVGVRVRVELGPKDAESGNAIIALAGTPGTVAKKKSVNVAVQLVREVKAALEKVGTAVRLRLCSALVLGTLWHCKGTTDGMHAWEMLRAAALYWIGLQGAAFLVFGRALTAYPGFGWASSYASSKL